MKTLVLTLDGLLQRYGKPSRNCGFSETYDFPTRSAVAGMCAFALELPRLRHEDFLGRFANIKMGVRVDRPGHPYLDFQTAVPTTPTAEGKKTNSTVLFNKVYRSDAAFTVALMDAQGDLLEQICRGFKTSSSPIFLGSKLCLPSRAIVRGEVFDCDDMRTALLAEPWVQRNSDEYPHDFVDLVLEIDEWRGSTPPERHINVCGTPEAFRSWEFHETSGTTREIPPSYGSYFVFMESASAAQMPIYAAWDLDDRPEVATWSDVLWQEKRQLVIARDKICRCCGEKGREVHHLRYAPNIGKGHEDLSDLMLLCNTCHTAVTSLEYGSGLRSERINPLDPAWRDRVLARRAEVVAFKEEEQSCPR